MGSDCWSLHTSYFIKVRQLLCANDEIEIQGLNFDFGGNHIKESIAILLQNSKAVKLKSSATFLKI